MSILDLRQRVVQTLIRRIFLVLVERVALGSRHGVGLVQMDIDKVLLTGASLVDLECRNL